MNRASPRVKSAPPAAIWVSWEKTGHTAKTAINTSIVEVLPKNLIILSLPDKLYIGTSKNLLFFSVPLQFLAFQATKHAFYSGSSPKTEVFRDVHI
jgi:hypothetical protein